MRWNKSRSPRSFYDLTASISDLLGWASSFLDGVDSMAERQKLVDRLDLGPGEWALEIAPGTGINLKLIRERIGQNGRLVGVDISRPMLEQIRKRSRMGESGAIVLQGDAMRLPLKSCLFDAVMQFGGFNRFADPSKAMKEMARVAKPGGRIVIGEKSFARLQEKTLREKLALKLEPQLNLKPPLDMIPDGMRGIELEWCWGGLVYVLKFTRP